MYLSLFFIVCHPTIKLSTRPLLTAAQPQHTQRAQHKPPRLKKQRPTHSAAAHVDGSRLEVGEEVRLQLGAHLLGVTPAAIDAKGGGQGGAEGVNEGVPLALGDDALGWEGDGGVGARVCG